MLMYICIHTDIYVHIYIYADNMHIYIELEIYVW